MFLAEEAEMAGEEVVYELEDNDVPGLSPSKRKMQLTYYETSMVATGDSEKEAMNNVALEMLKVSVHCLAMKFVTTDYQRMFRNLDPGSMTPYGWRSLTASPPRCPWHSTAGSRPAIT